MRLNRLKEIRAASGKTQIQAAEDMGTPIDTYRGWEQLKSSPRANELMMLADYFSCTVDDLLGRTLPKGAIPVIGDDSAFVMVRLYGSIAAGEAIEMIEEYELFPVPKPLVERHPEVFLLTVKGTSMDKVLPDGCYALIDPVQIDVINGQIYAITVNGYDATVKKLMPLNNGMRLVPQSTDETYQTQTLDFNNPDTEALRIIGRVVWYTVSFEHFDTE